MKDIRNILNATGSEIATFYMPSAYCVTAYQQPTFSVTNIL
jgi:hypothetical protein